ncbi:phosphatidylglycerol lysyltransferase domain-containing protein [Variovorax sp. LjRoot84]|uniref:phosphatidylglycerol lysyltransferase domain-containing protein n=1 Tax=Variovorax sp. LjRoot84 TaxID=3342340 RepID=UPI003ECF8930
MTGLPLDLRMRRPIDAALASLSQGSAEHCLSDHAFSNLYLFRAAHDYRFLAGEWPCISGRAYDGTRHLMPLFDPGAAPIGALRVLLEGHDCFYPVASRHAARLAPDCFSISASRDDADYLYAASTFAVYPGRALAKKRNLMRQFLAAHVPSSRPFDQSLAAAARQVLQGWMAQKGKGEGEADDAACLEAIDRAAAFGLEGYLYFAEGQPVGFVLAQELQPGVFVMRFAKGLDSHNGIYPYMFHHFCTQFPRRVAWLNFEQDMGLPGFRRSKMSFQPSAMLPKLRVRLNPEGPLPIDSEYAQDGARIST